MNAKLAAFTCVLFMAYTLSLVAVSAPHWFGYNEANEFGVLSPKGKSHFQHATAAFLVLAIFGKAGILWCIVSYLADKTVNCLKAAVYLSVGTSGCLAVGGSIQMFEAENFHLGQYLHWSFYLAWMSCALNIIGAIIGFSAYTEERDIMDETKSPSKC